MELELSTEELIAFATQPPISQSSSVVSTQTWKADDKIPLALFHKKFWGKSMKDEESEGATPSQGLQIRMGMGMDQDQNETMDMEDNIISGCYILDIGIPR